MSKKHMQDDIQDKWAGDECFYPGELTVYIGPMFSNKTSALLGAYDKIMRSWIGVDEGVKKERVCVIKPVIDNRSDPGKLTTHSGHSIECVTVDSVGEFLKKHFIDPYDRDGYTKTKLLFIDEIQFFPENITVYLHQLLARHVIIHASGLLADCNCKPFQTTINVMCIADKIKYLKALCCLCGRPAMFSYRAPRSPTTARRNEDEDPDGSQPHIEIGGAEIYRPMCRAHYYHHFKPR